MNPDVIRYIPDNGDYEIFVKTEDLSYSWVNFKGRINYRNITSSEEEKSDPMKYCRYTMSDNGKIYLLNLGEGEEKEILVDSKQEYWPVVFETDTYHICIMLHGVDADKKHQVFHVRKDIEKKFVSYPEQDKSEVRILGSLDFINNPGLFKFDFEYYKNNVKKNASFTFEVVSPKLDTKYDYKRILDDVNEEFDDIIFNYLSATFQQFGKGNIKHEQIWMQKFHQVVNDYLKNIDRIIKNPHSKVHTYKYYAKADKIKRWSPSMEEEYAETKAAGKLEEHYFGYEQYETTVNSLENRFVKHTLKEIGSKLSQIFDNLLKKPNKFLSDKYVSEWKSYQYKIDKYQKHPFFKSVGRFEGLKQESLVLQSRMGYQQIYKDWLKLKKGIDFYNGATNIGTLQIWEIYELWCFLKVKKMVRELMGFDPKRKNSEYAEYINEPNGTLVNYNRDKKTDYRIVYKFPNPDEIQLPAGYKYKEYLYKHQGEVVSLHYQHTFNRDEDDFYISSVTTEQRPDIVLNITKSDGFVLTYLYDAKYRVWSDKTLDKDFEEQDIAEQERIASEDSSADEDQKNNGADYPPSDAINQMHRYRDAIYYGLNDDKKPDSKEIIGGYILFPGRGNDKKIKERYFYKSIDKVNIGAFPLLPNQREKDDKGRDIEGPQLWEHLIDILLTKEVVYNHIDKSIPQRGLKYSNAAVEWGRIPAMIFIQDNDNKWKNADSINSIAIECNYGTVGIKILRDLLVIKYVLVTNTKSDSEWDKILYKLVEVPNFDDGSDGPLCWNYHPDKNGSGDFLRFKLVRADEQLNFDRSKVLGSTPLFTDDADSPRLIMMGDIIN